MSSSGNERAEARGRPAALVPTIQDVASAAGVSTSTVSRVLSGSRRVTPAIADRVRMIAGELDYRPHTMARNLRQRASSTWGLIISDIQNQFYTAMVRGIEDGARSGGCSLIVCSSDEDLRKEADYIELMIAEHVAGVIITPSSSLDTDLGPLRPRRIPVVAVDREVRGGLVDTVVVDNRAGARAAVTHLVAGGARRIACITGPPPASTATERLEGYREALALADLAPDPILVRHADFKQQGGYLAAHDLLKVRPLPDALFVANNLMTVGALEALAEAGFDVPDHIAVASFDEMYWTELVRPRLTTVAQPTYELGRHAARLLSERIDGYAGPPRLIVLETALHVRDSSRRDLAQARPVRNS